MARASDSVLWPPNHKLLPIRIRGVADPEDHRADCVDEGQAYDSLVP